jgi:hypothetical protein
MVTPHMDDRHKHECDGCGCIWEHNRGDLVDDPQLYDDAHLCPDCDWDQRWRYEGRKAAKYHDHHRAWPNGRRPTPQRKGASK